MQPTLALACGERSKLGCAPAWQLRHFASTSLVDAFAGLKILVVSPPPSTCALPAPWQFSQVTPLLAVHQGHLGVGIVGELLAHLFMAGGAGIRRPQSPTKPRPWPGYRPVFPFGAGAPSAVAHRMLAPSINIKQARSPGLFPGTAPISNCATGLSLCMKNTALCALIASLLNRCSIVSVVELGDSLRETPCTHQIRRTSFSRKLRLCGASLHAVKITVLSDVRAVMSITHHKIFRFNSDLL